MSRALAALMLCVAVAASARGAPAAGTPPPLPTTFYGSVTLDGAPAPDGTTVSALAGQPTIATAAVFTSGGQPGLYRIDVTCDAGAVISFSVPSVALSPQAPCAPGSVVPLDLSGSTATATATASPTETATATATATASPTATGSPTATATGSPTATTTGSPTATATVTDSPTATATATDSPTATATGSPTATATATRSPTATASATRTATPVRGGRAFLPIVIH